jgi:mRNA interferase MazF
MIDKVKKGEVYLYRVSRKETEGTEIMKTRLGVIFSTNELNRRNRRFIIIPLTSKKADRIYDYEVSTLVEKVRGKVLIDQIKTINRSRLLKKCDELKPEEMDAIHEKLLSLFDS